MYMSSFNTNNNSNALKNLTLGNRDLDYGINDINKLNIDERVLKVCNEAEKNYISNQKSVKEIEKMKIIDKKIQEEKNKIHLESVKDTRDKLKKREELTLRNSNEGYNYSNYNGERDIEKDMYSSNLRKSQEGFNSNYSNGQLNSLRRSSSKEKIKTKTMNANNSNGLNNQNNLRNSDYDLNFNYNRESGINNYNNTKSKNPLHSSTDFLKKPGHQCGICDLKKKIENKPEDFHSNHIKFKYNFDINNIILESKLCMKKLQFKRAYEILKFPIVQGIKHSDMFYLYGEVCRILKNFEESEKFLLDALRFEQHSPYVYYSGGLLYQELGQFRKSVNLFKHFLQLLENADTHFQIAKSYVGLKNYLKAALHATKALTINSNCVEYFKFRSYIYEIMGFSELSKDDLNIIKQLTGINN